MKFRLHQISREIAGTVNACTRAAKSQSSPFRHYAGLLNAAASNQTFAEFPGTIKAQEAALEETRVNVPECSEGGGGTGTRSLALVMLYRSHSLQPLQLIVSKVVFRAAG